MPKLECALARKYGNFWSTCTGTCCQAPATYFHAVMSSVLTPVLASGGTTSVPLWADRVPSAEPVDVGYDVPTADSRLHCGSCDPVSTTGASARAPLNGCAASADAGAAPA